MRDMLDQVGEFVECFLVRPFFEAFCLAALLRPSRLTVSHQNARPKGIACSRINQSLSLYENSFYETTGYTFSYFHPTHPTFRKAAYQATCCSVKYPCVLSLGWSCERIPANENPSLRANENPSLRANENPALRCQLPFSQFFFDFYFLKNLYQRVSDQLVVEFISLSKFYLLRQLRRRGADSRQRIADQPRSLSFGPKGIACSLIKRVFI